MSNRIIVADDSVTVQKVIKLILSPRGYQIDCYSNGKDALLAIKRDLPALVIADAIMPEFNGVDLGETLRKGSKEIKDIPLILIHSSFEDINDEDLLRSGAKKKLAKPFEDKQLIDAVEEYMTQEIEEKNGMPDSTWDMDSFARPEVPDMKNPIKTIVKHGGDIEIDLNLNEEEPPIFKVNENEKIEDIGIPDADKFRVKEEKKHEIPEPDFGPEVISEDESKQLMKEVKLMENPDGTITFDDLRAIEKIENMTLDPALNPEQDLGLWTEKYYEHVASSSTNNADVFTIGDEDIPHVDTKPDVDDRELVRAIAKEVVEKVAREMLPEIAERIIREEIQKIVNKE